MVSRRRCSQEAGAAVATTDTPPKRTAFPSQHPPPFNTHSHAHTAVPVASPPFRRVLIFVDNAGADVVLGMIPFVRELLSLGCEVVLAANSLPAINDITAPELKGLLSAVAELCPVIKEARQAAAWVRTRQASWGGGAALAQGGGGAAGCHGCSRSRW